MKKIDITTLETEDLAPAQLAPRWQKDREPVTLRRRFDRSRNLSNSCDGTLDRAGHSRTSNLTWVSGDQTVRHCRIEAGPQHSIGITPVVTNR